MHREGAWNRNRIIDRADAAAMEARADVGAMEAAGAEVGTMEERSVVVDEGRSRLHSRCHLRRQLTRGAARKQCVEEASAARLRDCNVWLRRRTACFDSSQADREPSSKADREPKTAAAPVAVASPMPKTQMESVSLTALAHCMLPDNLMNRLGKASNYLATIVVAQPLHQLGLLEL